MENKQSIVLSKSTSAEALKTYFRNIQRMEESGEQFPVNLDEVWPIIYARKEHAVRVLRDSELFVEGMDYIKKNSFSQFEKNASKSNVKNYENNNEENSFSQFE